MCVLDVMAEEEERKNEVNRQTNQTKGGNAKGFSMKEKRNKQTIKCHYKTTVVTKKKLVTGCTAHDKKREEEIKTPSPQREQNNF